MSHDIKTDEPKAKEGEGFLRRLLDRIDPSAGDAHSGSARKSALDLGDIQGIILRGYRMPMVRHFLLIGRRPSGSTEDAGAARQW